MRVGFAHLPPARRTSRFLFLFGLSAFELGLRALGIGLGRSRRPLRPLLGH